MAFEWKLIGEEQGSSNPSPMEQQPAAVGQQPVVSAVPPETVSAPAAPASGYQPTSEATPGIPRCEVHNAAVNTTEKVGYNAAYDAEVFSSYDTGVNSEENSVVA